MTYLHSSLKSSLTSTILMKFYTKLLPREAHQIQMIQLNLICYNYPKKEKVDFLGFNIADLLFQFVMFILLFGLIFAIYFFVRSLVIRPRNSNSIEQKLDRIIELLEKDKKE